MRWNLNDPLTTTNTTYGMGIEITGYGSRQNFTQPFAAADIILLYDGYCASTCTLLSEFLLSDPAHVERAGRLAAVMSAYLAGDG